MKKQLMHSILLEKIDSALYQIDALAILLSRFAEFSEYEGTDEILVMEHCGQMIRKKTIEIMQLVDEERIDLWVRGGSDTQSGIL